MASKNGFTFVLTTNGLLCLVKDAKVTKICNLHMEGATTLEIVGKEVLCGGRNSLIKVVNC